MKIKTLALAVAIAMPIPVLANMQQQVNSMFGQLMNVTAPGAYQTATRGVVTGGGVVLRNKITTANLIDITPPSAKGGCGGINLYTGSFSFVNAEEFVALMRNVASNAVGVVSGYAFMLALEYMDAQTSGVIKNITGRIQQLNQMFSNSCQLASGIVNGGMKALEENRDFKSASNAFVKNVSDDFFGARSQKQGTAFQRLQDAGKLEKCVEAGNVVWCAMQKVGLASQIMFGSDENAEYIMSITGSYIVSLKEDKEGGKSPHPAPLPPLITDKALSIFVEGTQDSEAQIYECKDEGCLDIGKQSLGTFKGLKQRIIEDVHNSGVLDRYATGTASDGDEARMGYLMSSNIGINMLMIAQKAGAQEALNYFDRFAHGISYSAAYGIVIHLLEQTRSALMAVEFPEATVIRQDLNATMSRLQEEWASSRKELGLEDAHKAAKEILDRAPVLDSGVLPQGTSIQSAGN